MQQLDARFVRVMLQHTDHRTIDGPRTAAAAGYEHRQLRRVESEGRIAGRTVRRQHLPANGIAGEDNLVRGKMLRGGLRASRDLRDETGQDLIRDARDHVLFLDECRYMKQAGCQQDRPADVAARSDGRIRLEGPDDVHGLQHAADGLAGPQEVYGGEPAHEALYVHRLEGKSFLRNDVRLQTALRSHIEELRIRYPLLYSSYECQCRIDMTSCTAARYNDFQAKTSLI